MGQGQLDGLTDLLLLHVEATDVGVGHIGLLISAQHGDGAVRFWGQDVDQGVGVTVQCDRGRGLQLLAV